MTVISINIGLVNGLLTDGTISKFDSTIYNIPLCVMIHTKVCWLKVLYAFIRLFFMITDDFGIMFTDKIQFSKSDHISWYILAIRGSNHSAAETTNTLGEHGQCSSWCHGSHCQQDISSHGTEYAGKTDACHQWGRILTICTMSELKNYKNVNTSSCFLK